MYKLTPKEHICPEDSIPSNWSDRDKDSFRIAYHIGHEDGAEAQLQKLQDMTPDEVVEEIKQYLALYAASTHFSEPMSIDRLAREITIFKVVEREKDLKNIHDYLDDYNAENSDAFTFCVFCKSHKYNGHEGVIHKDNCVIKKLRTLLADELTGRIR